MAYILYSLYASCLIAINPFRSVLCECDIFTEERDAAVQLAGESKASDNKQLQLFLIRKDDGDHVSGGFSR